MSSNMSNRTNTDSNGSHSSSAGQMSIGLLVSKKCLACGKVKKPGTSHPKCSRILQGMSERGEI